MLQTQSEAAPNYKSLKPGGGIKHHSVRIDVSTFVDSPNVSNPWLKCSEFQFSI